MTTKLTGALEEMSHLLAHRFATKCFTPLELTHLKDNFDNRAVDQGGLRYWNEEILSRFLGIPDGAGPVAAGSNDNADHSLDAGPVIFRMVSYLGAFPFQNTLAPSVLTFEAMVKVVVLLTERYGRALRRGRKDRIKLLFGSLADVGRKAPAEPEEKKDGDRRDDNMSNGAASHAAGFSIDEPANQEEDEEDDDLALAALESLDAIEVFKYDQRIDRTVYEARVSVETFRRLLMLLVVIAPLQPMGTVSKLTTALSSEATEAASRQVDSILAAFTPDEQDSGIKYSTFSRVITASLPFVFDPLTPLFEHLLFSKNLDLSRRPGEGEKSASVSPPNSSPSSPPLTAVPLPGSFESSILDPAVFAHLSFFLATSSSVPNLFRNETRMHPIFSSGTHGESLTSFSHHVLTWKAPSILLIKGPCTSTADRETVVIGAYLPQAWKSSSSSGPSDRHDASQLPSLFQLSPEHLVVPGNPSYSSLKSNHHVAYFSNKTGIALGCTVHPVSRASSGREEQPTPSGGGSLLIDSALETATFVMSNGPNSDGVFLPPCAPPSSPSRTRTVNISIHHLEVWGLMHSQSTPEKAAAPLDAIAQQRKHWEFDAREAERRRNVNLGAGGGDSEEQSGRALLEMAGVIGDKKYGGR